MSQSTEQETTKNIQVEEKQSQQDEKQSQQQGRGGENDFFMLCSGLPVWQLMQAVSDFYGVNIIVFEDIKERQIYGNITGLDLAQTLDCVSWFLGVEWLERKGIYYIGGNAENILVFDSAGISANIETVFKSGSVKVLNDKIIASGSERDLMKIASAIKDITDRKYVKVHLTVFELTSDKNLSLGVDIQKSFEYAFSTANFLKTFDPVSHLSLSVIASLEAECSYLKTKSIINTDIGLLTGEDISLHVGDSTDRPVYSESAEGRRVVESYSTQETGLIIQLKAFSQSDSDVWFFQVRVENSTAESDLKKSSSTLNTTVKLQGFTPVLLCELKKEGETVKYEKGIPFLADIPYLGYLFRVTTEIKVNRHLYFVLRIVEAS
ncbi:MAG: hypothetical protein JXR78_09155 [Victivallales bacterium]|nr:hypothetical protein [Victivallales bacterium]